MGHTARLLQAESMSQKAGLEEGHFVPTVGGEKEGRGKLWWSSVTKSLGTRKWTFMNGD